jgi:hypothetical protein
MEPTTRGHSSSLGLGILQKGNPGSQILTPLTLFLIVHSLSLAIFLINKNLKLET